MIVSAVLSFVSDIAVSTLVKQVYVSARCPFDTSLISPASQPLSKIPVNGNPYTVVSQAQLTSVYNGGSIGIYYKVNTDPKFQAQDIDIAGSWTCTDLTQNQKYPLGTTEGSIVADLLTRGFLFDAFDSGTPPFQFSQGDNSFKHLVAVTSSQSDAAQKPFDVRVAVQLEAMDDADKIFQVFDCAMHAPNMTWVLAAAASQSTLHEWILTFQGSMYNGTGTPAAPDAGVRLERVLNSLVMVGAGGNYLLAQAPPGVIHGCLASRTLIPTSVIAVFSIVGLLVVALPLYLAYLLVRYMCFSKTQRHRVKNTPSGLVDWRAQVARESMKSATGGVGEEVKTRSSRHWAFGLDDDGRTGRVFRKGDGVARDPYQAVGGGVGLTDFSASDGYFKGQPVSPLIREV